VHRRRGWNTGKALPNLFAQRNPRKRKAFTFETLEQRYAFSATPLGTQTSSISSDSVEGAAAILMRELQWAALQSGGTNGTFNLTPFQIPTDPYFPDPSNPNPDPTLGGQWHLLNIGQQVGNPDFGDLFGTPGEDINVLPAWELGYTGEGVIVAVLDDGIQSSHPDLFGNMHPIFAYNAFDGTDDTVGDLLGDSHGTRVAGLIGATWSNEAGIPVTGGVGVAPEVTLVPILMLDDGLPQPTFNGEDPATNAFRYAFMIGADITNNSWGFPGRQIVPVDPEFISLLRQTVRQGRDGLGMIHVFASGNDGAIGDFGGNYNSATYSPYISSRYVIGVTASDHDGQYANPGVPGTVSHYANAGANVLVAAPSGTFPSELSIANDDGLGSGLWTTDLIGDAGANARPDPITGIDDDRDFLEDPNYTTRFGGTSGAAPLVSGVVALMLDANPNLTYRDVQEILVRSARQNAQFEIPETQGRSATNSSWQTNQSIPFRDPDAWDTGVFFFDALFDPIADPTLDSFPYSTGSIFGSFPFPSEGNDFQRQQGHYELQPPEFANGAGYTVSQGYGAFGELIGYGHGVVDAELAVTMARDWHSLNQDIPPNTERTYTTFTIPVGDPPYALVPAEEGSDDIGNLLVPGGIVRDPDPESGWIAFWNEYVADAPGPFDPADPDSWPSNDRGFSYIDFKVPVSQQMNVEWVEVKVRVNGPSADLNYVKINLTSPNGMQSELNHHYQDNDFRPNSLQDRSEPGDGWAISGLGGLADSDTFVWTFSTNRNWGESTNSAVIMNPLTGEPQAGPGEFDFSTGTSIPQPIFRDWELHLENWSNSLFTIDDIEIVWHGKPIAGGQLDEEWTDLGVGWEVPVAQRVQGFVGIDVDDDDEFSGIDPLDNNEWNNGYIQNFFGFDPDAPRQSELQRRMLDDFEDTNNNGVFDEGEVREMEPYAANILVEAFRYTPGASGDPADDVVDPQPIAQFLTGHDGNYYFDLVPGNYIIRATDRNALPGTVRDDPNTPVGFRMHYQEEWRINEDWFYAPDRDVMTPEGRPGEIFQPDRDEAPTAFRFDASQPRIPAAIKDLNFLLKPNDSIPTPLNQVVVNGTVYADVNGNSAVDIFDGAASNMRVFYDSIRNGVFDAGEQFVTTNADGTYSLTIAAASDIAFAIGVDLQPGWAPSAPGGALKAFFAGPGEVLNNQDFFLNPPDDPTGSGLGNITGFVFNDLDGDGVRDSGEAGIMGATVFIDTGAIPNGVLDSGEVSVVTGANGGYFIPNLGAGTYRIDVVATADQEPTPEFRMVTLAAGETRTGVAFGLENLAYRDFGDLPASFDVNGFPNHVVFQHFRLGETVDGETEAGNVGDDDASDDGVDVISNGGTIKPGDNRIEVQVAGAGGRLSGWIDWNGNGSFQAEEQITFIDPISGAVLGTEADLSPSPDAQELRFDLPSAPGGSVAARFRWGEAGLNLGNASFIGEVEDYILPSTVSVVAPPLAGDFNGDGGVTAADYVMLRKFMGASLPSLNGSASGSPVGPADQAVWETNFGATAAPVFVPPQSGDFNTDGEVDAADFVAFRKFVNTGTPLPNTTDPDSAVVPADQALWETNFGATAGTGGSSATVNPPANAGAATSDGPSLIALNGTNGSRSQATPDLKSSTPATSSLTFSPAFVGALIDVRSFGSAASTFDGQDATPIGNEQSTADALLLLDQAMAQLDESDDDSPLVDRKAEDDGYDDLALAAVFEENSTWWSL
jgi:subtilisin family serine protease